MKFGLTPEQYDFIRREVITSLEDHGATVWVFGSRARGDHKKFSDLDLMVQSDKDLNSLVSQIDETLVDSSFPFKVDLILEENFAESYRENFEKEKLKF